MQVKDSYFCSPLRGHLEKKRVRGLENRNLLRATCLRGFAAPTDRAFDLIISDTRVGAAVISGINKDWRSHAQNMTQFMIGNGSAQVQRQQGALGSTQEFLKTYGILGVPEGIAAHFMSLFEQRNYTMCLTAAKVGFLALGLPTKVARLISYEVIDLADISIRLALGLSAALCLTYSLCFPEVSIDSLLPIKAEWVKRSYKKIKWHTQLALWCSIDSHFKYHIEGTKSQAHRMPSRTWFHHFTSTDPTQRIQAYWDVRDALIVTVIDFSIDADYIINDPEKAYRSIELHYILGYLFGDVKYEDMIAQSIQVLRFLEPENMRDNYINPIFRDERCSYRDPFQYAQERAYIEGAVARVRNLYQSLLNCLQNDDVRFTLSLIPRHHYQDSWSGEHKIIKCNFGNEQSNDKNFEEEPLLVG